MKFLYMETVAITSLFVWEVLCLHVKTVTPSAVSVTPIVVPKVFQSCPRGLVASPFSITFLQVLQTLSPADPSSVQVAATAFTISRLFSSVWLKLQVCTLNLYFTPSTVTDDSPDVCPAVIRIPFFTSFASFVCSIVPLSG